MRGRHSAARPLSAPPRPCQRQQGRDQRQRGESHETQGCSVRDVRRRELHHRRSAGNLRELQRQDHRAERDAQTHAERAHHLQQAGGLTGRTGSGGAHDLAVVGRGEQALPGAGQRQEAGQQSHPGPAAGVEHVGQQERARQKRQRSGRPQEPCAHPVVQGPADRRGDGQRDRDRGEPQAGRQRRAAVDPFENERHHEKRAEQNRIRQQSGHIAGDEHGAPEQGRVDERRPVAQLAIDKADHERQTRDDRPEQHRRADRGMAGLVDRQQQHGERRNQQDRAD